MPISIGNIKEKLDALFREDSRRVFATLVRLLGDLDVAEDAMHDAFAAALAQWPETGIPENPRAWLISTGRFKAIDVLRRRSRVDAPLEDSMGQEQPGLPSLEEIGDEQLRLIFMCCHPSVPPEGRVALTLREVCGLTTEEIAKAFLSSPSTIAQRIVRAKAKIRDENIPYDLPSGEELAERLNGVLQVVYLVFNEGYYSSHGDSLVRAELASEAIRLGRLILEYRPEPEAMGLLALMLMHHARQASRTTSSGEVVLMPDQDRTLWDRDQIAEGVELVEVALRSRRFGPYCLQAAIAAVHVEATEPQSTDWNQIVALYDLLLRMEPTPIVHLNRAVAVAMRDGPEAGLLLIDELLNDKQLDTYSLAHSARADLYRRLGNSDEALTSYRRALEMANQEPERAFIRSRIEDLEKNSESLSN